MRALQGLPPHHLVVNDDHIKSSQAQSSPQGIEIINMMLVEAGLPLEELKKEACSDNTNGAGSHYNNGVGLVTKGYEV
jgi:hypothetical protein